MGHYYENIIGVVRKEDRLPCLFPGCGNKTFKACTKCHAPVCNRHQNEWHKDYVCSLYVPREFL